MQPLPQQQQRHAPPPIQVPPLHAHGGPILQQPASSQPVLATGGKRKEPEQPGASSVQCQALPGEPFGSPIRSNAPAPHARLHGSDLEPISEENAPLATAAPPAAESHAAKRRALQPPSAGGYGGSAGSGPRPWWSKPLPPTETGTGTGAGSGAPWLPLLPPSSSASPGGSSSAGPLAVVMAPPPSPGHPHTSEGAAKAAAWQRRADLSVTAMRPLKATGLGTSFKR